MHNKHYNQASLIDRDTLEEMELLYGTALVVMFCEMNAYKYSRRVGLKEGEPAEKDVYKRRDYLNIAERLMNKRPVHIPKKVNDLTSRVTSCVQYAENMCRKVIKSFESWTVQQSDIYYNFSEEEVHIYIVLDEEYVEEVREKANEIMGSNIGFYISIQVLDKKLEFTQEIIKEYHELH